MRKAIKKRTKIVCTLGPASQSKNIIKRMVLAGMDCARLNFSHGTYKSHSLLIRNIRQIASDLKRPIAIIQDLQGPKIRVGQLKNGQMRLKKGEEVILAEKEEGDDFIPVQFKDFYRFVKKGDQILLDDGRYELKVVGVIKKKVKCRVINGGLLFSRKGINIPTTKANISPITKKDIEDLEFGIKNDVDFVALSFVQRVNDILRLRSLIKKFEKRFRSSKKKDISTKIIAKIEKKQAIDNFDKILEVVDGVMVARGDLGIETPLSNVPLLQKQIINKCLSAAKPVITATQMLESMIKNPRPTRAEVSDVANAVIDHTDAVMLSEETATGNYPVAAVKTMSRIISETEISPFDDLALDNLQQIGIPIDIAVASSACRLAKSVKAKAILAATISGYTARVISRYRPELPIIVTAESEKVKRQLALSWGVIPYLIPRCKNVDELIRKAVGKIKKENLVKKGDKVIIIGGQPVGKSGNVNLVKIHQV